MLHCRAAAAKLFLMQYIIISWLDAFRTGQQQATIGQISKGISSTLLVIQPLMVDLGAAVVQQSGAQLHCSTTPGHLLTIGACTCQQEHSRSSGGLQPSDTHHIPVNQSAGMCIDSLHYRLPKSIQETVSLLKYGVLAECMTLQRDRLGHGQSR